MIPTFATNLTNRKLIYVLDMPSFQRDFASLKTLDHGTGPAITFTRASGATFFDANGVLQTAANNVARFDHSQDGAANSLGLLIEEARTNSIRNAQGGGAVVGAPGTLPTNYASFLPTGVSREVVSTGTENGFNYIDLKFSGTNTGASGFITVNPESLSQVVASSGQSWSGSVYVALVAGDFSGTTLPSWRIVERNAAGVFISGGSSQIDISAANATLSRFSVSRTLNNVATERVSGQLSWTVAASAAVDFTLRIAAPQLELGAFPTSYIPTTTAAATRSADSAAVTPIASFYNQVEGTLFAEASSDRSTAGGFSIVTQLATNDNSRIVLFRHVATSNGRLSAVNAGATQVATDLGSWPIGSVAKLIAGYKENDFAATINGASVTTDTLGTVPPASSLQIGSNAVATVQLGGHIRKLAYFPKRLTNTLLEQLTT